MTSDLIRLPLRRADVELREEGTTTWLVALGTGAVHELNPTARAIWELCDGTITMDELVRAICHIFDVPRDAAASDVAGVIEQLEAADLVTWSGVASSTDRGH